MEDKEFSQTPPELVGPEFVERIAFEKMQDVDVEKVSVTEAKRIILQYAMIKATGYILAGNSMKAQQDKFDLFKHAEGWLIAIEKTNQNHWKELLDTVGLNTMATEDSDFGSHEAAEKIFKLLDLISETPQGFK